MAEKKLGLIGQTIVDITGPDPKGEMVAHICLAGGKGRSVHRFTGPNGTAVRLREGAHVEVQWGSGNYVAFGPGPDNKWMIVGEQRDA